MRNYIKVKVGQVWMDWDSRFRMGVPIYKKILHIENGYAHCENKQNKKVTGKSRIRLDRFKPNSTGYKLVNDV